MSAQDLTMYNDTTELIAELREVGASQKVINEAVEEFELQARQYQIAKSLISAEKLNKSEVK